MAHLPAPLLWPYRFAKLRYRTTCLMIIHVRKVLLPLEVNYIRILILTFGHFLHVVKRCQSECEGSTSIAKTRPLAAGVQSKIRGLSSASRLVGHRPYPHHCRPSSESPRHPELCPWAEAVAGEHSPQG